MLQRRRWKTCLCRSTAAQISGGQSVSSLLACEFINTHIVNPERASVLMHNNQSLITICGPAPRRADSPSLMLEEKIGFMRKSSKFRGQRWRSAATFQHLLPAGPGLVLFWKRGEMPEEAEYLVPQANIRLRPVGKYPHGVRRQRSSQCSCSPVTHLAGSCTSFPCSLSAALLWFSEVYLLLTHPVSQPVLCHRTHGRTQRGSDSCLTASSGCTGTLEQRKSPSLWV